MHIFLILLEKILPIYLLILLGFVAGRFLKVKMDSVANIVVYIVTPVVIFNAELKAKVSAGSVTLPLVIFAASCLIAVATYRVSQRWWHDATPNTLGYIGGSSNSLFFGLPVAIAAFGNQVIADVAAFSLGTTLYLTTFGYFLAARGQHSVGQALAKVFKLPIIYAFVIGVSAHALGLHISGSPARVLDAFNTITVVLGMMLIGIALSQIKRFAFDFKFLGVAFVVKFIIWPLFFVALLWLDRHSLHLYSRQTGQVIILLSVVPFAANIVSFATILKAHPEKSSMAVFLGTLFALFYVPLVASLMR